MCGSLNASAHLWARANPPSRQGHACHRRVSAFVAGNGPPRPRIRVRDGGQSPPRRIRHSGRHTFHGPTRSAGASKGRGAPWLQIRGDAAAYTPPPERGPQRTRSCRAHWDGRSGRAVRTAGRGGTRPCALEGPFRRGFAHARPPPVYKPPAEDSPQCTEPPATKSRVYKPLSERGPQCTRSDCAHWEGRSGRAVRSAARGAVGPCALETPFQRDFAHFRSVSVHDGHGGIEWSCAPIQSAKEPLKGYSHLSKRGTPLVRNRG